jgi:hypothetical protein
VLDQDVLDTLDASEALHAQLDARGLGLVTVDREERDCPGVTIMNTGDVKIRGMPAGTDDRSSASTSYRPARS